MQVFIAARATGTPISFFDLLSMKFRKVDINKVGVAYITLRKINIPIDVKDLETAYLLNHDLENITSGLVFANMRNIPLTFDQAKAADKKGIKLSEELQRIR